MVFNPILLQSEPFFAYWGTPFKHILRLCSRLEDLYPRFYEVFSVFFALNSCFLDRYLIFCLKIANIIVFCCELGVILSLFCGSLLLKSALTRNSASLLGFCSFFRRKSHSFAAFCVHFLSVFENFHCFLRRIFYKLSFCSHFLFIAYRFFGFFLFLFCSSFCFSLQPFLVFALLFPFFTILWARFISPTALICSFNSLRHFWKNYAIFISFSYILLQIYSKIY